MPMRPRDIAVVLGALALASGCSSQDKSAIKPNDTVGDVASRTQDQGFRLPLAGGRSARNADTVPAGLGVNAFLWSATLDTIDIMPLESADPYAGLITTTWYTNPEQPGERFKVTVRILDTRLRADGVKATLYRQVRRDGGWTDAEVDDASAIQIENAILTRAQQLRIATLEKQGK